LLQQRDLILLVSDGVHSEKIAFNSNFNGVAIVRQNGWNVNVGRFYKEGIFNDVFYFC